MIGDYSGERRINASRMNSYNTERRAKAEHEFRANLADIGAIPMYETWVGAANAHMVKCVNGHVCYPRPNGTKRGIGICRTCAGKDPVVAEREFRTKLANVGAIPLYDKWKGVMQPHLIRCSNGHESRPYPNNVQQGGGICDKCAGKKWDVFYILRDTSGNIKFGVTSGDPKPRLKAHRANGYSIIVEIATNLPNNMARDIEIACIHYLELSEINQIQGREYFPSQALSHVQRILANRLAKIETERAV